MFHHDGKAHFLALFSASTAMLGAHWEDVKWALSLCASLFGTCAALWMYGRSQSQPAQTKHASRPFKPGFWNHPD